MNLLILERIFFALEKGCFAGFMAAIRYVCSLAYSNPRYYPALPGLSIGCAVRFTEQTLLDSVDVYLVQASAETTHKDLM